jgi:hypothetical protein
MNTKHLITALSDILIPLGFTRKGNTWNRHCTSFVDVINLQQSKAGDAVTINCGVLHFDVHRLCWGKEAAVFIEEPICTVRARIGELINGYDLWWNCIGSIIPSDVISDQVKSAVLPFLEKMHSEVEMEALLERSQVVKKRYPPPILYLAALKCRRGDKQSALDIVTALQKKTSSSWKVKVTEAASRLDLSLTRGAGKGGAHPGA